jgi:hypothetical protein
MKSARSQPGFAATPASASAEPSVADHTICHSDGSTSVVSDKVWQWCQDWIDRYAVLTADLLEALKAARTAICYAAPPIDYGTPDDPNPCYEARVPIAFVEQIDAAITKAEGRSQDGTAEPIDLAQEEPPPSSNTGGTQP